MFRLPTTCALAKTITTPSSQWCPTVVRALLLIATTSVMSGCVSVDYKRLAYDFLRQEDCRRNDLGEFCSRTFVFEYDEYEVIRREFLRLESEKFTDHMSAPERYQALHSEF